MHHKHANLTRMNPASGESVPQSLPNSPTDKLRAFLRSGRCRGIDPLDDYGGDFSLFVPLGPIETADMRHQRERLVESAPNDTSHAKPEGAESDLPAPEFHAHPLANTVNAVAGPFIAFFADRCTHRHARREGCRRCIETCSCGAIYTSEDRLHIDHTACMGCGACTTACPTGALRWRHSPPEAVLDDIKSELSQSINQGRPPIVMLHDHATDPTRFTDPGVPVIGLEVATIGMVGMEMMLTAIALGSAGVVLLLNKSTCDAVCRRLEKEVQWSQALLKALGLPDKRIVMTFAEPGITMAAITDGFDLPPAKYAFNHSKRTLLNLAIEHLVRHARALPIVVPVSDEAPFGTIRIDTSTCTLCMACAGACKTEALLPIHGEVPGLRFAERQCVQCGLCAHVCPEHAVTCVARLNPASAAHTGMTILHQAQPARCISCGRAFASRQMIATIQGKLLGHWMYDDAEAQNRLHMCDQCRVRTLFGTPSK